VVSKQRQVLIAVIVVLALILVGSVIAGMGYLEITKDATARIVPQDSTVIPQDKTQTKPAPSSQSPVDSGAIVPAAGVTKRIYEPFKLNLVCDKQDFFMVSVPKQSTVISISFTIENPK
jgi:hypothetical protein